MLIPVNDGGALACATVAHVWQWIADRPWGSWGEWFGGGATAAAVWFAVRHNRQDREWADRQVVATELAQIDRRIPVSFDGFDRETSPQHYQVPPGHMLMVIHVTNGSPIPLYDVACFLLTVNGDKLAPNLPGIPQRNEPWPSMGPGDSSSQRFAVRANDGVRVAEVAFSTASGHRYVADSNGHTRPDVAQQR